MSADTPPSDLPPDPQRDTLRELFEGVYAVHERLSWGGLGLVFRATEPGREVALTVLPIDCSTSEREAAFDALATRMSALDHPGLMVPTDHGVEQGVPFVEYELIPARTLLEVMGQSSLPTERALAIVRDVATAVDAAHVAGLPHLDLTPSTVMIQETLDGDVTRVFGAGIAAAIANARDNRMTGPTGRGSGPHAGRFLAPEVRIGGDGDARSDVYSLGALLAFMIGGEPPPLEGTPELTAPPAIGLAIARAMAPNPGGRPESIGSFLTILAEAEDVPVEEAPDAAEPAATEPTTPASTDAAPPSSTSSVLLAIILTLLAIAAFYAYRTYLAPPPEITTTEPDLDAQPEPEPEPEPAPSLAHQKGKRRDPRPPPPRSTSPSDPAPSMRAASSPHAASARAPASPRSGSAAPDRPRARPAAAPDPIHPPKAPPRRCEAWPAARRSPPPAEDA